MYLYICIFVERLKLPLFFDDLAMSAAAMWMGHGWKCSEFYLSDTGAKAFVLETRQSVRQSRRLRSKVRWYLLVVSHCDGNS